MVDKAVTQEKETKASKSRGSLREKHTSNGVWSAASSCRATRTMGLCQHAHSRAQDNSILQALLEVGADGEARESLDPAAEFFLLLRVIFGQELEEQRAQGRGKYTPSSSLLKPLAGQGQWLQGQKRLRVLEVPTPPEPTLPFPISSRDTHRHRQTPHHRDCSAQSTSNDAKPQTAANPPRKPAPCHHLLAVPALEVLSLLCCCF